MKLFGNTLRRSEEAVFRVALKVMKAQTRASPKKTDADLSEIRAIDQRFADGSLRAQVLAETITWLDTHPEEGAGKVLV